MVYSHSTHNSPAVYLHLLVLTAVFLVALPHTLIHLAGVTIALESVKPAFAGGEVSLPVEIINGARATRHGITLARSGPGRERTRIDHIPAGKAARVTLRFPARQRGKHEIGTLCLTSVYPLGFIRVLKKFRSEETYIVYTNPYGNLELPSTRARSPQCPPQAAIE